MVSPDDDFEYEEIAPAEVDQVVEILERLQAEVQSQTVREFLEECSTSIYYLVYDDEDGEFEAAA